LPEDLLDLIRSKVASGDYANESQVVLEGLRLLASNEDALEDWLHDEVAPTYDRAMAEPESLLDLDAAFDGIREGLLADWMRGAHVSFLGRRLVSFGYTDEKHVEMFPRRGGD